MGTFTFAKHSIAAVFIFCAAVTLSGCGSGDSEALAEEPQVDSRFASADALLAYYNSVSTVEPVDMDSIVAMLYAETPRQHQLVNFLRQVVPIAKLDYATYLKFNECLESKRKRHMLYPDGPARMTTREDGRCQAVYVDRDGDNQTLHLVRIGERWWLSGYTLEYDQEFMEVMGEVDFDKAERAVSEISNAAAPLANRVRAGEFQSVDNVRSEWATILLETMLRHSAR